MLSNRRNGVVTAPSECRCVPVPVSVRRLCDSRRRSRARQCRALDAAIARRAGIPPAAGVPKSVKTEKIGVVVIRVGRGQADDRAGVITTVERSFPLIVVVEPTVGSPRFVWRDARGQASRC